jgi:hypothetical protein
MKQTVIHPKGWTEEDAQLVAEYVAEAKKDEEIRKKTEWRKTQEIEAGRKIQLDYYAGRINPRDMPAISKNRAWENEQLNTAAPFGTHDRQERKRIVFILVVSALVVFIIMLVFESLGLIIF